ncbi:transport and Golgi organization protein 11 isoform X2 [Uranotaenia lowii]|uniref:transport and Golgi organization protein 11 isoform X2 n=1 Tax=Uranotaenia lowii TaxID=190385 RepID=UPI002478D569|nr:transport and Golgi organization protein 11 isoform X2 [Uranotaenia lowii]
MAHSMSPGGYSNYEDDALFQGAAFTHDISEQMRVPKRIRATGDYYDDHELLSNGNGDLNSWNYRDKIEMNVPDRIVVLGQDQHLVLTSGTKSAPREIMLENSILPKDPGMVRVLTPPRVISLAEHHFPSASDEPEKDSGYGGAREKGSLEQEATYDDYEPRSLDSIEADANGSFVVGNKQRFGNAGRGGETQKRATFAKNNSELIVGRSFRDETPTFGGSVENLAPSEELTHLRRQVTKMNRRLLTLELNFEQRQQREKLIYAAGLAYLLLKTFMWMTRK